MNSKKDELPQNTKILIVEDSPTQAMQLQHMLEHHNYQVLVAGDGIEALALLKKHRPLLIISDILMPEMDGFELCQKIKEDENLKDIPVILLTSLSDSSDVIKGIQCGAQNFIIKPYSEAHLLARIKYILVNQDLRKVPSSQMGLEIFFGGEKHFISAERMQIIDLLISTYENAVQKNRELDQVNNELMKTQQELRMLNEQLEKKVMERTQRITHLNRVIRAIRNVNQLIVRERNLDLLLQGVCDSLIGTRGYSTAWIALLDESEKLVKAAEAGIGKNFLPLIERLERGDLTECAKRALAQSEVVTIQNISTTCIDCPLAINFDDKGAMSVKLEHSGKVYGLLTVSVPVDLITDKEEHGLFKEVAEDIAYALYNLEGEENRQKAEKALRESAMKYRSLFDNSRDTIIIIDEKGYLFDVNKSALDLFDYTKEEMLGKNISEFYRDNAKRDLFIREMEQKGYIKDFEDILQKKDGTKIECLLTVTAWKTGDGNILGYHGIIRDVTERKNLEAQLFQAQKMEAIGRLAGGVAHDFNNLLTTIIGQSEIILMTLDKDNPAREGLEEIRKAADNAASLTSQLLAFSHKRTIQPKVLDLGVVITDMEKMLRRLIGEDIELLTNIKPGLGRVKVDPGQVEQVIMNLAVNARDAMPHGGKLSIELANVDLDEAYTRKHIFVKPGPYVMLAVSDTGIGISKEIQSQIFDPFFTTKEIGKGTGLGLSTVYGITKQNGGYIWVYSEPGEGATFKIYLPRVEEEATLVKKEGVARDQFYGSETILVVEDNEMVRNLTEKVLRQLGYRVLMMKDAEEALKISGQYDGLIHLVITDLVMPGMGGKELSERLLALRPEMKVLFMSGYTDTTIVNNKFLDQDVAFIQKPFTIDSLGRKVREVLES